MMIDAGNDQNDDILIKNEEEGWRRGGEEEWRRMGGGGESVSTYARVRKLLSINILHITHDDC